MAVPPRLTIVTLGVADVARSTAFYEAVGWQRSSSSQDSITFLRMAGSVLGLYGREALADDVGCDPDGHGFAAVTLACNLDSPGAVDAAFAEFVTAGASPVKHPAAVFWGGYSSYVADPDGHLWELAHNPFLPFDDEGRPLLPA
jgi:uncharacterized protein